MRFRALTVAVAASLVLATSLAACSAEGSPEPAPSITGAPPTAVAYDSAAGLYEALSAASDELPELRVQGLSTGAFPSTMPSGSQKAEFVVLGPEQEPYPVVAAVYASPADRTVGAAFGRRLAERAGAAVWQLEGPNWAAWSADKMPLFMLQWAIGGALSKVVPAASPSAMQGS